MTPYHAPQIIQERWVHGRLECCSTVLPSDAQIKHNVQIVRSENSTDYQAPQIRARRDLAGRLGFDSVRPPA